MFSSDPGYRVVILEGLFGVSLLICRPKGNTKCVKVNHRKIELRLITQPIEQRCAFDVTETEIIDQRRAQIRDPVCRERGLMLTRVRGKQGYKKRIGRSEVSFIVSEAELILRVQIVVNVRLPRLRVIGI